VAVRHSALSLGAQGNTYLEQGQWLGALSYRWLHSDRHFRGDREEPNRQENGSEVVNDIHSFDLTATYAATKRFSLSLTLPFVHADRSSLYEHDRTNRHSMQAGGLGDMRFVANAWLFNPDKNANQNISLGIGVKAPTGDHQAVDYAYRTNGPVLRPVDQSIQPGDGGWGIILEMQAFVKVYKNTYAYVAGSYLINPREVNGTETPTSGPGNVTVMSVPDQYMGKAGLSYTVWPEQGLSLSLGGRIEGVPVRDLIGGSEGFRRPGFSIGIEPGLAWNKGRYAFTVSAPVALYRNREKSVSDLRTGGHGDAAFADWFITAGISRRF